MQATSMEHIGRSGTGGLDPDQRAGHDTGQESLSKTFARNFPVYGRIADGWLLSSDFRPNDELLELRWVWQAAKARQLEARARRPKAVDLPAGKPARRRPPLTAGHLVGLSAPRHEPSPRSAASREGSSRV